MIDNVNNWVYLNKSCNTLSLWGSYHSFSSQLMKLSKTFYKIKVLLYGGVIMGAPSRCPQCGAYQVWFSLSDKGWHEVTGSKRKSGYSVGKGLIGGAALGPLGLVAGGLGKKQKLWKCEECGYMDWF